MIQEGGFGVAMTPGFTSDPQNGDGLYLLDSYYALREQCSGGATRLTLLA